MIKSGHKSQVSADVCLRVKDAVRKCDLRLSYVLGRGGGGIPGPLKGQRSPVV